MPTYINSTDTVVEIDGVRIEPGEIVKVNAFLEPLPAGVTRTSVSPNVDPILYSALISTTTTVDLTTTLAGINGSYELNFFCATGSVSIQLVDSGTTAKILVAGERWTFTCMKKSVIGFIVTVVSGTVSATVSK